MKNIIIFLYLLATSEANKWKTIQTSTSESTQNEAVLQLIKRILPSKHSSKFFINITSKSFPDKVTLSSFTSRSEEKEEKDVYIVISAATGVNAALGLHHYLKYTCNCHISLDTIRINLPETLPEIKSLTLTLNDKFRYWSNVCTFGYTYAFWKWSDWSSHIDWMALMGINLPLAFNGQEIIWKRVYSKFNISDEAIQKHFAGPAFLPWGRMGNIEQWGGPLSEHWLQFQRQLQHRILERMRSFGMTPVLPAFAGHVPSGILENYPTLNVSSIGPWNSFPSTYILEFTDPMFQSIGHAFIEEYSKEYGTDHIYNCDAFNEMTPRSGNLEYLTNSSRAIYEGMEGKDQKAVWLMQGWLFLSSYWTKDRIMALLNGVSKGSMIILDLDSTFLEQYTRTEGYFGHPFIFNDLSNYGGNIGLWGRSDVINNRYFEAKKNKNNTIVGIGFTPEGISNSYVTTELMTELVWRKDPVENIPNWFENYSQRRYGVNHLQASQAWRLLSSSVYNASVVHFAKSILILELPSLNLKNYVWYDSRDVLLAWDYMIQALDLRKEASFRFDLLDLTRQVFSDLAPYWYNDIIASYKAKDYKSLYGNSTVFLDLLRDMNRVLCTNSYFMLGSWLKKARNLGASLSESSRFVFNAKNQITLWGPTGEILDYGNKQWCGLISHYYIPRWLLFFEKLETSLMSQVEFNQSEYKKEFLYFIGIPFVNDKSFFPSEAQEDTIHVVKSVYKKWRSVFSTLLF